MLHPWGFSGHEYCNGLPCPPPEDLLNAGIEPEALTSPALAGGFFTSSTTWETRTVPSAWNFSSNTWSLFEIASFSVFKSLKFGEICQNHSKILTASSRIALIIHPRSLNTYSMLNLTQIPALFIGLCYTFPPLTTYNSNKVPCNFHSSLSLSKLRIYLSPKKYLILIKILSPLALAILLIIS